MTFNYIIDLFLHLDKYLNVLISQYNILAYVLIFLVIFIETGFVVIPFLPGDSLLFATGAISAKSGLINIPVMLLLLYIAAIAGDTLNYHIGHMLREKVKKRENIRFVKMEYIIKAQEFLKKHGGITITIARFIPIIRTFAPFVAGAGKMPYTSFIKYNIAGGIAWVTLFFGLGYFFGNIEYVQSHFGLVVIAIVFISIIPGVVAFVRSKLKKDKPNAK